MKSIITELSTNYPSTYKDLNKNEIKTFENLHKQIRSDVDWHDFVKIFFLYLEGVINLKDMFTLFDEKFAYKLKDELKLEIEQLLPTR